mgnify:CR=1 FL=1
MHGVCAGRLRTAPVFEVRAVDERGCATRRRPRQTFQFSNQSPSIVLVNRFIATDTTFASATVQWAALDPDGEATRMRVRVWLDGNQANADLVPGSGFTIPRRSLPAGRRAPVRPRTVYVQAIDDGGAASRIDSRAGTCGRPVTGTRARLLIIDDVPSTNPTNFTTDTLYQNTAGRNLAAGDFSILRFEFTQPFRSTLDVQQTFELFDAVVWYRGTQTTFSTPLNDYQAGIGHFLDHGGNFYLEGLNLFAGQHATGPLTEDFMRRYLGARLPVRVVRHGDRTRLDERVGQPQRLRVRVVGVPGQPQARSAAGLGAARAGGPGYELGRRVGAARAALAGGPAPFPDRARGAAERRREGRLHHVRTARCLPARRLSDGASLPGQGVRGARAHRAVARLV